MTDNRLGYKFKNPKLLETALTHSSYVNENGLDRIHCNERLEFLGDSILGYITAEYLFYRNPDVSEGYLTKTRSILVREESLASASLALGIGNMLRLGKGEEQSGGRTRPSILADAFEAALAAIFLDGGMDAAKLFVYKNILRREREIKNVIGGDYKTQLQEIVQAHGHSSPQYSIIKEIGPDHERVFTAEVFISGVSAGIGSGKTKKDAEQSAAKSAVNTLKI
ncbi:MAG: ribonuclease III [Oscillospiraceae bacterium]|jgi:ribonuclease-3|nr:ribonuclease III [Oscillospiraceae bacterium]